MRVKLGFEDDPNEPVIDTVMEEFQEQQENFNANLKITQDKKKPNLVYDKNAITK